MVFDSVLAGTPQLPAQQIVDTIYHKGVESHHQIYNRLALHISAVNFSKRRRVAACIFVQSPPETKLQKTEGALATLQLNKSNQSYDKLPRQKHEVAVIRSLDFNSIAEVDERWKSGEREASDSLIHFLPQLLLHGSVLREGRTVTVISLL